jgi:hemoglobin
LHQADARLNERQTFRGDFELNSEPTPFELIGGAKGVEALVVRFYAEIDNAPGARGFRALHSEDLEPVKFVLKRYIGE